MLVLPATGALPSDPLILRARIDDQSGVESVTLWVKGERDGAYRPLAMQPADDGTFTAKLAPWPERGTKVAYFVEATDRLGNGPRRSGNERTPYIARLGSIAAAAPAPVLYRRTALLSTLLAFCFLFLIVIALHHREKREVAARRELQFWRELLAPLRELKGPALQQAVEKLCAQGLPAPNSAAAVGRVDVLRWLKRIREIDPLPVAATARPLQTFGQWNRKDSSRLGARSTADKPLEAEAALAGQGPSSRRSAGMTLIEILVVLTILGVALGMAGLYLKPAEAPLRTGAELVDALIRQTRARAMANTMAHRIRPTTDRRLEVEYAGSCSAVTWTPASRMSLDLPRDVTLSDTLWSICFTSRGLASDNFVIALNHPTSGMQQLEVLLGGAVKWLPRTGYGY